MTKVVDTEESLCRKNDTEAYKEDGGASLMEVCGKNHQPFILRAIFWWCLINLTGSFLGDGVQLKIMVHGLWVQC